MGIFDRMKKRNTDKSKAMLQWLQSDGCVPSGYVKFTDSPEVAVCASIYARLISSMTLHLLKNTDLGDKRIKNGISRVVDIAPHPKMTRRAFYEYIIRAMLLDGNGNAIAVPVVKGGRLEYISPLEPDKLRYDDEQEQIIYNGKRGETCYSPEEVLHFVLTPHPSHPWRGTSYGDKLNDAVNAIKQADKTKKRLLSSPSPALIIKVDGLTEEFGTPEGRAKLANRYLSDEENGRPWIIPSGYLEIEQVKPVTINDLAIREGLELDKKQIASMFGVPAFMLGVGAFNADEYNAFLQTQVLPIAKSIEQELTKKLLIEADLHFRFNFNSLYAYSLSDKVEAGLKMTQALAMSRNEWRDWVGFSPREDMEQLIVLENYIPADKIGEQKKLKG